MEYIVSVEKQEDADEIERTYSCERLIRCKDCKFRPKQPEPEAEGFELEFPVEYACPCECDDGYYSWYPSDDWFCANGKRKDVESE